MCIKFTKFRQATKSDMDAVMALEREMYGEDYTRSTFESWLEAFSEGFILATKLGKVIGFVVIARIDRVMAIPYVHNATDYFASDGDVFYLAGFGVKKEYQPREIGTKLYRQVIELARQLGIKKYVVLCNREDPEDAYETSVLTELGFSETEKLDWEVYPGKIKPHTAWVLDL